MSAKRALLAAMATVGLLFGLVAPTSGAQDGSEPPPPPLAGTTSLVTLGNFSAVTYLQIEFPNGIATCTGTLIDPMWVLTAAHCVQDEDSGGDPLHADEIRVMIGGNNANTQFFNPPAGVEVHTAVGWIIHGDYESTSFGISNDVALLKLPEASDIDPIALATDEALVEPANGSPVPARAFGFGQCGESSGACNDRRLRMGSTDIHSDSDVINGVAIDGVNFGFSSVVRSTNLFMAPDVTEDGAICPGDSGGPLMVQQNGNWRVAGVNSFIALNTSGAGNCVGTVDNQYLNAVADVVGSNLASYVAQVIDPPSEVCWSRTPTLEGTSFPDTIIGGPATDVIHGRGGRDFIWGRASGDRLCGGPSGDEIYGSTGADRIKGNTGNDYLDGWTSDDIIDGGDGDDTIFGWTGNDKIDGEKGRDEINGEDGDDELIGGSSGDTIRGGEGDDVIRGGSGHDRLFGNQGHDDIRGESGNDEIGGGKAGDTLRGGGGDDEISGNSGHDDIWGNSGNDALLGGTGRDDLSGGSGTDSCGGGPGADTKTGCESLP